MRYSMRREATSAGGGDSEMIDSAVAAIANGADRLTDVRIRRHEQHRQHRVLLPRTPQGLQARQPRHPHIRDYQAEVVAP